MFLLIDTHYLGHRASHSTGDLVYNGRPTGVIFGVLNTIQELIARFSPEHVIFFFDTKPTERLKIFPEYKGIRRKRKEPDASEKRRRRDRDKQMNLLENEILPAIGFKNRFKQVGFEADDLIAAFSKKVKGQKVIVSADSDLYQLLSDSTVIFNPSSRADNKLMTKKRFVREYGIRPSRWIKVKAIAGCSSDGVPGAVGVGEKSVLAYYNGTATDRQKRLIHEFMDTSDFLRNLKLVKLPFPGTAQPRLIRDETITERSWRRVLDEYGITSF